MVIYAHVCYDSHGKLDERVIGGGESDANLLSCVTRPDYIILRVRW